MSDGSNTSQKILLEPLKNIGAQDILKIGGSTYNGTLRKRGGRFQKLIGSAKWKQRFVVIAQGCIYCFKDEYAQKPLSAFALAVYESVHEVEIQNVLHAFEIKHEYNATPSQFYACATEDGRKTWIAYIREAITDAHLQQESQKLSNGSDEGISMTNRRKSHAPLPPLPPTPSPTQDGLKYKTKSEYSFESDDEEGLDEYSEIVELQETTKLTTKPRVAGLGPQVMPTLPKGMAKRKDTVSNRPVMPLPQTPGQPQQQARRKNYEDTQPHMLNKPDYINEDTFTEEEFFFNSADKTKVHSLLEKEPEGTFLVRLGNSTPTVLSVKTPLGIKEFQITENEAAKVSINRSEYFPTLQTMLCYYNQHDLPKKEYSVKLRRGFKTPR